MAKKSKAQKSGTDKTGDDAPGNKDENTGADAKIIEGEATPIPDSDTKPGFKKSAQAKSASHTSAAKTNPWPALVACIAIVLAIAGLAAGGFAVFEMRRMAETFAGEGTDTPTRDEVEQLAQSITRLEAAIATGIATANENTARAFREELATLRTRIDDNAAQSATRFDALVVRIDALTARMETAETANANANTNANTNAGGTEAAETTGATGESPTRRSFLGGSITITKKDKKE